VPFVNGVPLATILSAHFIKEINGITDLMQRYEGWIVSKIVILLLSSFNGELFIRHQKNFTFLMPDFLLRKSNKLSIERLLK
jgi:hypothetical protein